MKKSRLSKLLAAFGVSNADTVAEAIEEIQVSGTPTNDSIDDKALNERLGKVESGLAEIKALFTKGADDKKKAQEEADAAVAAEAAAVAAAAKPAYTADAIRDIVARAEILAPGISIPTTDALAAADAAEQLMRAALDRANGNQAAAECIKPFLMGRELKVLTGDALLGVFNGSAELMRVRNNQQTARTQSTATKDSGKPLTIDDMNARNAEFWARQK